MKSVSNAGNFCFSHEHLLLPFLTSLLKVQIISSSYLATISSSKGLDEVLSYPFEFNFLFFFLLRIIDSLHVSLCYKCREF